MVLSVTQVTGWATAFNALAVLARPILQDLGLRLPMALAGSGVFLLALALASRALVPLCARYGAGRILALRSLTATAGFVVIATSSGPVSYGLGWLMLEASWRPCSPPPAHSLLVQVLWYRSWGFAIVMVELLQASG